MFINGYKTSSNNRRERHTNKVTHSSLYQMKACDYGHRPRFERILICRVIKYSRPIDCYLSYSYNFCPLLARLQQHSRSILRFNSRSIPFFCAHTKKPDSYTKHFSLSVQIKSLPFSAIFQNSTRLSLFSVD